MQRLISSGLMVVFAWFYSATTSAQISFGVTQQNGVVTGGNLVVGGFLTPGRTGVTLGINGRLSNVVDVPTFNVQSQVRSQQQGVAVTHRERKAAIAQFVRAAERFDADKNKQLDKDELERVATAVVEEISRLDQSHQPEAFRAAYSDEDKKKEDTDKEIIDSFVKRSLSFDSNEDESLSSAETRKMAAAFLRSFG